MTAFVTGGGGFIGRHLVRQLREAGTEVRAIARSEASAVQLRAAGCEVVVGDVLDSAALRTALEGCSVAYHLAGDYRVGIRASDRDGMLRANVTATERLLDVAMDAGVGGSSTPRPSTPSATPGTASSTRPTNGREAHVDDIAAGIVLVGEKGVVGESFVLGGEITTMAELVHSVAAIAGRRPPRLSTPTWALRAAAPIVSRIGPNVSELISSSAGVTYWATDAKARRELGYTPRDLEAGLSATFG